ncbi:H-type lectin domain-containing protein [Vannielia litorea]|uniref:H-type lectin domain-containing protein n=1 Tax=Vannielia TaxID=2813041 RepID=UPI001C98C382|nr:H-type lectin domain-containing protein [Vannielia litorea]MBY6046143.1 H-type lectin domain-containing protein [Vannielia litorea]MBY6073556.1 H-type lectin domain-containing protein [Vannielia litorea]MBY6153998.1 H-type lectin domain-containing protein [Vannielia litorea]
MKRLRNHLVGVDEGSVVLFSDFEDGGEMWTGTGPRQARRAVSFSESYRGVPTVMVNLAMWDMDQKTNPRADISAENITNDGFELVFRTWGDTRVARVRASWMAIGELRHEDDWELS